MYGALEMAGGISPSNESGSIRLVERCTSARGMANSIGRELELIFMLMQTHVIGSLNV